MFTLDRNTTIPTVSRVVSILESYNSTFGIPLDYDRMLEYLAYYKIRSHSLKKRIIDYIYAGCQDKPSPETYKDTDFLAWLKKVGVSEGLLTTKGGALSISADSLQAARNTGKYSKEICTILEMYEEVKSCVSIIGPFVKILDNHKPVGIETWDNHRMILVQPIWVPQNTKRIGAREPAVTNFAKDVGDIFTVPKGYIYKSIDSSQIEPRSVQSWYLGDPVLKNCTMAYNDAYYGYIHYCTMLTAEERRNSNTVIRPVEITEELKAKRKRYKTYGNAAMYGATSNTLGDPEKDKFIDLIGGHSGRLKLVRELEDKIDRGQRIFETFFGTQIDITKGPSEDNYKDKNSDAYFRHLVKCAINNPMQGTAADLMRYSVVKADSLLRHKAPNSLILQYVHDAGKFMIDEDEWADIEKDISEITAYQVEDWLPINCEVEGLHVGEIERFVK